MWELLICHICKGLLENPKILTCAHSVCEKCLKELLKQKSEVLKCPVCSAVIQVAADNDFLSSVLDILKRETNACNEDSACDACSVHGIRNLRCMDCDMLLCTRCLHAHHDSVITRENEHARTVMKNETGLSLHEIENELVRSVNTDERVSARNEISKHELESTRNETATRNDYSKHEVDSARNATTTRNEINEHEVEWTRNATAFARDHQVHMPLKCRHHRKEDLRFFCNSCAQLVCQECVIAKHITHIFVSASDAAPSSKAQLSTLLNQTTIRILYLSEALGDTKDTEEKLKSCVKEITDTIRGPKQNSEDGQRSFAAELTTFAQKHGNEAFKQNSEDGESTFDAEIKTLGQEQVIETFEQNSEDGQATKFTKITNSEQESDAIFKHDDNQDRRNVLDTRNDSLTPQTDHCSSNERRHKPSPQREALLNYLNMVAKRKFEVLAKHRKKVETRLALIENCQRFTMNLIHSGSDEEVLMLENCIMESLGNLCQNTPEVPIECPDDAFIALTWRENHPTTEQTREFDKRTGGLSLNGERVSVDSNPKIITGEGCCSSCFATGEGLTSTIVGQDCAFTVTVKNQQNKPCIEGRDSIIARIKTPYGGYFRAELIEHKLGKHKFRYRTYSAGPHILRITLRGEEILGSPFETLSSGSTDYSQRGRLVTKFGRLGSEEGELCQPQGLAVDRLSRIFVADTGNHRIQVFDESGRFLFAFGRKGSDPGEFNEPCDVTIAHTGHVIVADRLNDRLQFFTPDGKFVRQMQCGVLRPIAVTTDQYNNIVTVDSDHSRVLVITMGGERLRSITRGTSSGARLENVQDVACNQTGETFLISRIPALNSGGTTATQQTHASLVQVFDNNGTYIREFVTPSYTRAKPTLCRLVTDYDDRVLATGSGNKVQVFTRVGGHLTNITFTEKECSKIDISAITLSPSEAVVVADTTNGRILVF